MLVCQCTFYLKVMANASGLNLKTMATDSGFKKCIHELVNTRLWTVDRIGAWLHPTIHHNLQLGNSIVNSQGWLNFKNILIKFQKTFVKRFQDWIGFRLQRGQNKQQRILCTPLLPKNIDSKVNCSNLQARRNTLSTFFDNRSMFNKC